MCFLMVTAQALPNSVFKIRLGNKLLALPNPIFIQNDRIYASVRDIGEALGIPIVWDAEEQEVHMDISHKEVPVSEKTQYKADGVIPDEETAYVIGKTILEKYLGHPVEYETEEFVYTLSTTYLPEENAWSICQNFKPKYGAFDVRGKYEVIEIKLNKNTGEVMFINTYGTFSELE